MASAMIVWLASDLMSHMAQRYPKRRGEGEEAAGLGAGR